jgi:hypothetical protein
MSHLEMSKLRAAASRLVKAGFSPVRAADEVSNAYALTRMERDEILRAVGERRKAAQSRVMSAPRKFI